MPIFFLRSVKSAYPGLDSSIAGAVVPLIPQTLVTTRQSDMSRCMHLRSLASKSGAAPSPITGSSIQSSAVLPAHSAHGLSRITSLRGRLAP
ncbi:hypothetical protein IG631_09668 [Alternaria alternata]|nr:hypothetical protein IG631_09668 [Alternaria alternata]